jgi:hypothetical protein
MSGTRRTLSVGALMLVVSIALVGSLLAEAAGGAASTPAIDGAASTTPRAGNGTVTPSGSGYDVCVPYWAKSTLHHFVLTKGGSEVDSLDYTVPADEKTENATTKTGIPVAIATTHSGGVNGSPSKGCFKYEAKKTKSKKKNKKK